MKNTEKPQIISIFKKKKNRSLKLLLDFKVALKFLNTTKNAKMEKEKLKYPQKHFH